MHGIYNENDYDIFGTIVGVVEKESILACRNIETGDLLIGFHSNGLHTNGYSLARGVLLEKYKLTDHIDELNRTLAEELLRVHKSYLNLIRELLLTVNVKAFAHLTGGGLVGHTSSIIPDGLNFNIHWVNCVIPLFFNPIHQPSIFDVN